MKSWRTVTILGLGVVLIVAGWLRWRYIQEISLYVDEFTTIWAATRVQELGLPLMPSGVLYTRGLLASYVEAAFLTLLGQSYAIARLPSLIFGLATIVLVFFVGRREWDWRAGWLAAVGLMLLPEAIVWSGRARFYAQLQLLALATLWAAYVAATDKYAEPRRVARQQWTFALLFVLALFSQEETLLLYPAILLGVLIWRGWRFFLRPAVWSAHLACLIAIGARYLIETQGQPGYFETIQDQRPYFGLIFDVVGALRTYSPLLIVTERLGWTLLSVVAICAALLALHRVGWRVAAASRFHQATLYFALQFLAVFVLILTVVGTTWRESRYLFFVQPLWLLVGAAGASWLIDQLRSSRWRQVAVAGLTVLLVGLWWPPAQTVLARQVEGYDLALEFLQTARQSDDVIMTPQPPACALALGPCDYYAVQRGYEEYVIEKNGALVDRWSGAELLDSAEQLETVIRSAPSVWFLTDSFRLATRYDADFVRTVVEQFDLAFTERGILVLKAEGWREPPVSVREEQIEPSPLLPPLYLTGWQRTEALPGESLYVSLFWRGDSPISAQYNTSLQLVAADGSRITQSDGPPARGMIPTTLFFDMPLPDLKTLSLPEEMKNGLYRLEVSVYDAETATPSAGLTATDWFHVGPEIEPPAMAVDAAWEKGLYLAGWDGLPELIQAGDKADLRLVWRADAPIDDDYTAFVHLVDADDVPVAQRDQPPLGGFFPTSAWSVGDPVEDVYPLDVPADGVGMYRLIVGWYDPETQDRLRLADGEDTVELAKIKLGQ